MVAGLCALTVTGAMAQTDENRTADAGLDAEAVEVLTRATDFLAAQERLAVDWFVSFDVVIEGREKITLVRSGQNLLERANGLYASVEFGEETREFYYDGTAVHIVDVEENSFVMAPFAMGVEALAERLSQEYDVRLPIWQLMSGSPGRNLLEGVTAAAHLGITRLAGRPAHHLAFSDHDRDLQVWVADDPERPEILMIVGTDPYTQGWPQFRAYFTRWDFEPEVTPGVFDFVPDEAAERMTWPRPVSETGDTTDGAGE
ncbi:DUF2092 domain-containing protein [Seohaeicola saemankumensis]|nr:DUF2092 domain-containing protein [Seohaeicola saemankumensis]MCA0872401.1 DUF2092 domain-containing protein [Seohaeicola saemankumensis]